MNAIGTDPLELCEVQTMHTSSKVLRARCASCICVALSRQLSCRLQLLFFDFFCRSVYIMYVLQYLTDRCKTQRYVQCNIKPRASVVQRIPGIDMNDMSRTQTGRSSSILFACSISTLSFHAIILETTVSLDAVATTADYAEV